MGDQPRLLPFENPLIARLGRDFFKSIPKRPGVYTMIGGQAILYVGKAKDLRARLNSYKRATPEQVSRKVIRMLNMVREIRWEECPGEAAALLRENQLLRELRPPFNVVNTSPESYLFVGLRIEKSGRVRFRLTTDPEPRDDRLHGAFKGRGTVRLGYGALLRLLWVSGNAPERFAYPPRLIRYYPPSPYEIEVAPELAKLLPRFFNGTSERLLSALSETILANEGIPPFVYHVIQEDLEMLRDFYGWCPLRNKRLRTKNKLPGKLIAQELLDDLLVIDRLKR